MRYLILIILLPLLSFTYTSNNEDEFLATKDMVGVWLTHKKDAKVEIYEANGKYQGKVIWSRDEELPDYDVFILKNFRAKGKKLVGGKVINPINGKKYRSVIKLRKSGKLKLKVMSGFLHKNIYWTRVE